MIYDIGKRDDICRLFLSNWARGRFVDLIPVEDVIHDMRPDWDSDVKLFLAIEQKVLDVIVEILKDHKAAMSASEDDRC